MKAEEKAKELVDRFRVLTEPYYLLDELSIIEWEDDAKECAIICVDEILENQYDRMSVGFIKYWQEVKQEIEKL